MDMPDNGNKRMTLFVVKKCRAKKLPDILHRINKDQSLLGLEDDCRIIAVNGSIILSSPQGIFDQGLLACTQTNTILAGEIAPYIASYLTSDFIPYTSKVRIVTPKEIGILFENGHF
jgi:hypothetical protein